MSNHDPTRRGFLARIAGAAALAPAALSSSGLADSLNSGPDDGEGFWQKVRDRFSFGEDKVPMNAANLCPTPDFVANRVVELTRDIDLDCSFNNREKFATLLEQSREKVATQIGVTPDEIALVRNTSEANNTINNGLKLQAGDEIVLWDQNHPTNNVAWDVRAARFGWTVRRVATPPAPADSEQLVRTFEDAFTSKTRVLAVTHASNVSGVRLPVRQLCEAARKRGIFVHVDGAQSWGALDVNLRQLGCDSYAASAHKWFVGPKEVGILYVRQDRIGQIWPNVVAPGWGTDVDPDVRGARKFESMGQRDDAALAAVGDAADFHLQIGGVRIQQRVLELARDLKSQLMDAGFKLVTPMDDDLSAGVCIIAAAPTRRAEVVDRLYRQHGIAGSPSGGLRLCPHIYNTRQHVRRAVDAVKEMRSLIG